MLIDTGRFQLIIMDFGIDRLTKLNGLDDICRLTNRQLDSYNQLIFPHSLRALIITSPIFLSVRHTCCMVLIYRSFWLCFRQVPANRVDQKAFGRMKVRYARLRQYWLTALIGLNRQQQNTLAVCPINWKPIAPRSTFNVVQGYIFWPSPPPFLSIL